MEKYRNFSLFIILIPTPDFPHFYYTLGGNLGSLLYGDVSVMISSTAASPSWSEAHKTGYLLEALRTGYLATWLKKLSGFRDRDYMSRFMRKPTFCICETKTQISFAVTAKLISAFVFATKIEQSIFFLNRKFQASSHLL